MGHTLEDTLDAMCWANQTTTPDSFEQDLLADGVSRQTAADIVFTWRHLSCRNLLFFYEGYGYSAGDREWKPIIAAYIGRRIAEYHAMPPTAKNAEIPTLKQLHGAGEFWMYDYRYTVKSLDLDGAALIAEAGNTVRLDQATVTKLFNEGLLSLTQPDN